MKPEIKTNLEAMKCPNCGAPLGEGLVCAYCSARSERVSAANKLRVSVTGENPDLQVGGITFNKRVGFNDEQLEAIAGQVAEAMASGPGEEINYLDFSLPLEPKPGRPAALLVEVHRGDSQGLTVLFESGFPAKTHQRLRAEGRIITLPAEN